MPYGCVELHNILLTAPGVDRIAMLYVSMIDAWPELTLLTRLCWRMSRSILAQRSQTDPELLRVVASLPHRHILFRS